MRALVILVLPNWERVLASLCVHPEILFLQFIIIYHWSIKSLVVNRKAYEL